MLKTKQVILSLLILNLQIVAIQFFLSSKYSQSGNRLSSTSSKLEQVKLENQQLKMQVYSLSSISRIYRLALSSGYQPAITLTLNPPQVALAP
ncbi:hypothetical protein A3D85_02370 [Candidatus Amesbacteria bacterium RIFCSPHIGHO2_02_FULL_47_9]|uniref:Cell division protein FtsL n=1 Tax=Candidatus Amesbacteria bacterium RIFCSPHIGHO2_01_FULL_48_32b TaxID=1797253 RepID=A0A1F4YDG1_9BACT|nr:MAG: hypothetical protein A2876_03450 [Candidatus Amesbacteria bacterium RIFCSPHIGHO2_01_FULL_48_32b]OGD02312.1 MAG: hypothetical protein A3D85_02370 [Candidatus Amesbacteria bacterium RIFCSPHIGHO2_02_FULL_47_9]OGD08507.1 MAG: hypothetical protein A2899_01790 [Candidatus Amesbacteria bacterium RIFCSPLOWO2_01_FULL_49_25]